jgi:hypothetical protein
VIRYKDGYKYQLVDDYAIATQIIPDAFVLAPLIRLDTTGELYIRAGYAWDGPSGPTFDTKSFMRGSLVHDAFYQLMREGRLGQQHRKAADDLLVEICKQDGMWAPRRWWVHTAVRLAAGPAAEQQEEEILTAP